MITSLTVTAHACFTFSIFVLTSSCVSLSTVRIYHYLLLLLVVFFETHTNALASLSLLHFPPYQYRVCHLQFCLQRVDLIVVTPDIRIGSRSCDGLQGAFQESIVAVFVRGLAIRTQ